MSAVLKSERLEELHIQITHNAYVLYENIALLAVTDDDSVANQAIVECVEYIETFAAIAEQNEWQGLFQFAEFIKANLITLPEADSHQQYLVCSQIERLPYLISNYLHNPADSDCSDELLNFVQADIWLAPLSNSALEQLSNLLTSNFAMFDTLSDTQLDETSLFAGEELIVDDDATALLAHAMHSEAEAMDTEMGEVLNAETANVFETLIADEAMPTDSTAATTDSTSTVAHAEVTTTEHTVAEETQAPAIQQNFSDTYKKSLGWSELSNQVVEISDSLAKALHKFITAEDDSDEFLEGLEEYTNTVQILWEKSEEQGVGGIQTVCTFINDNVFELSAKPQADRFNVHDELALWPQRVLDYLQTPEPGTEPLVNHLQSGNWSQPLSEEHAKTLSAQLLQEALLAQMQHKSDHRLPSNATELATLAGEPAPADVTAETDLTDDAVNQTEAAALEDMDAPAIVQATADIEAVSLTEDALDTLEVTASADITATMAESLNETGLDDIAESSPVVMGDADGIEALSVADEPSTIATELTAASDPDAIDTESFELLSIEVAEICNDFLETINEFTHTSQIDTLQVSGDQCIEYAQGIEDAAGMVNLAGLDTVCEQFRLNIQALSVDAEAVRNAATPLLQRWLTDLQTYLEQPLESAEPLVTHLTEPAWLEPLATEEAPRLLARLLNQPIPGEASAAFASSATMSTADAMTEVDVDLATDLTMPEVADVLGDEQPVASLDTADVSTLDTAAITAIDVEDTGVAAELADASLDLDNLAEVEAPLTAEDAEADLAALPEPEDTDELADLVSDTTSPVEEDAMLAEAMPEASEASELLAEEIVSPLDEGAMVEAELAVVDEPLPEAAVSPLAEETPPATSSVENDDDQAIVIANPDTLQLLIDQITESSNELTQQLVDLVGAEDDSEALLTTIETYTETVQGIWDVADMAQLGGLQDVCTFINDNVMGLGMQSQVERLESSELFAEWPAQVLEYLHSPQPSHAQQLIAHLQQSGWSMPLEAEAVTQLYARLMTPVAATADSANDQALAENSIPSDADAAAEDIVIASPEFLELLIAQASDTEAELNVQLEVLTSADDASEDLLMAVESYTEHVQGIWDAADMASLTGLQEVCSFINDNIMGLSAQAKAERAAAKPVFADWLVRVNHYLQTPSSGGIALVQHLCDSRWPLPLAAEQASELQQKLLTPAASSEAVAEVAPEAMPTAALYIADPDILELICNQIGDVTEGLSAALEECISMENDNPAFFEAIENYTNHVQAIWDAADMAQLTGLQEVCTFVNDNLMALSAEEQAAKLAAKGQFEQWPNLVLGYLHDPLNGAPQLVTALQASEWPQPLAAERASELLAQLTQPATPATADAELADDSSTAMVEMEEDDAPAAEDLPGLEVDQASEVSLGSAEVLEILTGELSTSKEELSEELAKFVSAKSGDAALEEGTENYADIVMRLYAAAEMLGLEGLQKVCEFVVDNTKAAVELDPAARGKAKKVFEQWPDLVLAYLEAPVEHVVALLNSFRESQWPKPLNDEQAHEMLNLLTQSASGEGEIEESEAYARQTVATPEDVALTIPEDVNAELLDAYLQETPQHAGDFSECIQNIIADAQVPEIEKAQRIAHTLKGSSNIIGIKGIANMGHHLEDTLEYLAQHQVVPPKELTDTMVEAADCIEMMVDSLTGQDDPPDNAQSVLQRVLDWANKIDKGDLSAPPAPSPGAAPAAEAGAAAEKKPAAEKKAAAAPAAGGAEGSMLRVPTKTVDELMRLVGELSISMGQIQERFKHVLGSTRTLIEENMTLQHKTFELETLVDVRGVTGVETGGYRDAAEQAEDFDALEFEEYNELHTVAHSFIESIADNRELSISIRNDLGELETMLIEQERLNKEFQATIMTTRMVPVSTMISKLQRNVRQTCRATGKEAELEIEGSDILMDSDVLNKLGDPLQHILRNAIDHGLEAPDERELLGKERAGIVLLRFYREGNNIVVSCQDNGQGLNYTNIRYTAIQRGLITESQELTEKELGRLILMSGFSTKAGVTQVSGRGVGMDVVHTSIRDMKGTLDIDSETGKGTLFTIKLPMTLVTVHVLVVRVGKNFYGVPTNTLLQAIAPGLGEFHKVGEEITLKIDKDIYAVKALSDLLGVPGDKVGVEENDDRALVLVREEAGVTAVIVDELMDTHDLVMKNMGRYVTKIHGVAGASILGDGSLVPLLDVPELLRSPMQAAMSSYMAAQESDDDAGAAMANAMPHIMVVDDSMSVRKSLTLLLEDAGFETLTAKDGLEAIEVMNEKRPNVMLVDMEMPRMNGLELTAHVRANAATKDMPIFMITSRTTEKHREQAKTAGVSAYLTKPYQDVELLGLIDKALAAQR